MQPVSEPGYVESREHFSPSQWHKNLIQAIASNSTYTVEDYRKPLPKEFYRFCRLVDNFLSDGRMPDRPLVKAMVKPFCHHSSHDSPDALSTDVFAFLQSEDCSRLKMYEKADVLGVAVIASLALENYGYAVELLTPNGKWTEIQRNAAQKLDPIVSTANVSKWLQANDHGVHAKELELLKHAIETAKQAYLQ